MANFTTVRDLRSDALWIAGESQTSVSSYYTRSLEYLNAVLIGLVAGGPLGALDLPAIDWWWANKSSPGDLVIPNAFNTSYGVTVSVTTGSTTVTFSSMPATQSLVNNRLAFVDDQDQLLFISAHTTGATTATLSTAWQKANKSSAQAVAWLDYVALPTDFSRLTTPLHIGRYPYEIAVVDANVLERRYPRSRLWLGTPQLAAMLHSAPASGGTVAPVLRFSHMLQDGPLTATFEYLTKVAELVDTVGTEEPPLPQQHRRALSLGAAYLMLFDKVDAKYATVAGMFQSAWNVMAEEHYRHTTDNQNFGRILSRPGEDSSRRFPLRSPSGFIYG